MQERREVQEVQGKQGVHYVRVQVPVEEAQPASFAEAGTSAFQETQRDEVDQFQVVEGRERNTQALAELEVAVTGAILDRISNRMSSGLVSDEVEKQHADELRRAQAKRRRRQRTSETPRSHQPDASSENRSTTQPADRAATSNKPTSEQVSEMRLM